MLNPAQRRSLHAVVASVDRRALRAAFLSSADPADAFEQLGRSLAAVGAEVESGADRWGPERRYFEWSGERAPRVAEAELWLVPASGSERLLCREIDDPGCCMGALRSTSAEGDIYDVVPLGFGTRAADYRRRRMTNKVALVSGHEAETAAFEALAARGAAGLLCGPGGVAPAPDHRRERRLAEPAFFDGHRPFGFNLTAALYHQLSTIAATGEQLRIRVKLRVTAWDGALPWLEATLLGTTAPARPILLAADLPGDAGAPAALCACRALHGLAVAVRDGALPPPRRPIRIRCTSGSYGAVARLAAAQPRPTAALCIAAPPTAALHVHRGPSTTPSVVPDLLTAELEATAARLTVASAPFDAEEPAALFAAPPHPVPAATLTAEPRHGAVEEGRGNAVVGAIAAAAWSLANADHDTLPALRSLAQLYASRRLVDRALQLRRAHALQLPSDDRPRARHLLWLAEAALARQLQREQLLVHSCSSLIDGPGDLPVLQAEITAGLVQLKQRLSTSLADAAGGRPLTPKRRPLAAIERRAARVVPRRQLDGPAPLPLLLRDATLTDRRWLLQQRAALAAQPRGEPLLQWVDGKRSLLEIAELLRAEGEPVDLRLLWRYLEVLERLGWVRFVSRRHSTSPATIA